MLSKIVTHTPLWVWGLLLALGMSQMVNRTVTGALGGAASAAFLNL